MDPKETLHGADGERGGSSPPVKRSATASDMTDNATEQTASTAPEEISPNIEQKGDNEKDDHPAGTTPVPAPSQSDAAGPTVQSKSGPVVAATTTVMAMPDIAATLSNDAPYHVYGERAKMSVMMSAGFMAMVSPLTAAVYYPSINDIARDLDVSISLVNLTITTYMIFQGLAPSFVGSFSDSYGRRPAYIFCYTVYLAANIGLALQDRYAALMVLRCLQSAGSSGTIALGSAVVADMSTRAERGKYIGWATLGTTLGPALGPLIGGALTQQLGWRSIFWFLAIMSGVLLLFTLLVMPETCRAVVGNGSIPPPRWNRSLLAVVQQRRAARAAAAAAARKGVPDEEAAAACKGGLEEEEATATTTAASTPAPVRKRPNPLTSAKMLLERESGILLIFGGLTNAGYFLTLATLTSLLSRRYGFDALQIGLCYLPVGLGTLTSRWTAGTLLDRNFRRWAARCGLATKQNRQQDISNFPVERARLGIHLPAVYAGAAALVAYGWTMQAQAPVAAPLVVLFFLGHCLGACNVCLATVIVDINKDSPAAASAATNLTRCLFGAGAAALALPLIDAVGTGWAATLVAASWIALSPLLWWVYFRGLAWRRAAAARTGRDAT